MTSRQIRNLKQLEGFDDLIHKTTQLVSEWEDNPATLEGSEYIAITLIESMWDAVYGSAISTFVRTIDNNFYDPNAKKPTAMYQQIMPLLGKWRLDKDVVVDQQIFEDFKGDLRVFSSEYPKWSKDEWLLIPELNPQLCWGEWQKLCCGICDKKAPSVWWLPGHFGGRCDTEGATGEKKPITYGMGM